VLEGEAMIGGKPDPHLWTCNQTRADPGSIPAGAVRDASFHDDNTLKVLRICAAAETRPLASPAP